MKLRYAFLLIYFVAVEVAHSQNASKSPAYYTKRNTSQSSYEDRSASVGVGIGLDYGGFGARFTYLPDPHIGLFAAGGYALAGLGLNGGAMVRFQPQKKFVPTINAMYGYNGAIVVSGASQYNKLYYGPSLGLGLISKSKKNASNYWHFELIIPFRSSEYDTDLNAIKNNPSINLSSTPPSVLFSVGYHFGLN